MLKRLSIALAGILCFIFVPYYAGMILDNIMFVAPMPTPAILHWTVGIMSIAGVAGIIIGIILLFNYIKNGDFYL